LILIKNELAICKYSVLHPDLSGAGLLGGQQQFLLYMSKTIEIINEFLSLVDSIYGVYLDSTFGFRLYIERIINWQNDYIKNPDQNSKTCTIESLDSSPIRYSRGHPDQVGSQPLHEKTQGQIKQRNRDGDENDRFIANMCLVSIYSYWEDHYRDKLAKSLSKTKDDILIPIMGDIRHLRRSIIHNKSIAIPDVSKNLFINWFNPGDIILLDQNKMEKIIFKIYEELEIYLK